MASNVLVDSSFLIALLNERDSSHLWALTQPERLLPPWKTCEAVLSEAFHLLGENGTLALAELIEAGGVICQFDFTAHAREVLQMMEKYSDVPMAFADACLVRMTEVLPDPLLLTTDSDFRVYRRHGRQVIPCVSPQ